MKAKVNDPYDELRSVRAFCAQLCLMQSDVYHFQFNFAFKRSLKQYSNDFDDAYSDLAEDFEFFAKTNDNYVYNCLAVRSKLIACLEELGFRYGFDLNELMEDNAVTEDAQRFQPYSLLYKHSKSYKKLRLYLKRTLVSHIEYLYKMACVFMIKKYRIPIQLRIRFEAIESKGVHLLDEDNNLVALIKQLIIDLVELLDELRYLITQPSQMKFD